MTVSSLAWRNDRWRMYNQICLLDDLEPKLKRLVEKYGMAFDDEYWYSLTTRKGSTTVSRIPLWLNEKYAFSSQKSFCEHPKKKVKEKTLELFILSELKK